MADFFSMIKKFLATFTGADPELILGCCKILQKNLLQYDASNQRDFIVDYFDRSCIETDIMALAWAAKLSEQRAISKNLLSFSFYSLLHGIIKTFIKSFTRFVFVQYKHHTLTGHMEDINPTV